MGPGAQGHGSEPLHLQLGYLKVEAGLSLKNSTANKGAQINTLSKTSRSFFTPQTYKDAPDFSLCSCESPILLFSWWLRKTV